MERVRNAMTCTIHGAAQGRKDFPQVTLGERLTRARELAGLTQKQAASRILDAPRKGGVPRYQTVQEWEGGVAIPNLNQFRRTCEAYGVSADWLLFERGEPRPLPTEEAPRRLEVIRRLLALGLRLATDPELEELEAFLETIPMEVVAPEPEHDPAAPVQQ